MTAGNTLTDPIVIDEEDQYGNVETGDNSTVVVASLASGTGTLKGTTTATVTAGWRRLTTWKTIRPALSHWPLAFRSFVLRVCARLWPGAAQQISLGKN